MKKVLSLFLIVGMMLSMMSAATLSAGAAEITNTFTFDQGKETNWSIYNSNAPDGSEISFVDSAVKLYIPSSTNGFALKHTDSYGSKGHVVISYDIKIESGFEPSTVQGLENSLFYLTVRNNNSSLGWKKFPYFMADGTFSEGNANVVWTSDEWYTVKYDLECIDNVYKVYIKKKSDADFVETSSGTFGMNIGSSLGIGALEFHPTGKSTIWLDNITISTKNGPDITNISDGMVIDAGSDLQVKGTLPADCEYAQIWIGGIKVADIETGSPEFDITIPASAMTELDYGYLTLSLVTDIRTVSRNVIFSDTYTESGSGIPSEGNYGVSYGNGVSFSQTPVPTASADESVKWLYTNDGSTLTFTKQETSGELTIDYWLNNYPTSGKHILNWKFSVSDSNAYIRIFARDNITYEGDILLQNGKNQLLNETYTAGAPIDLTMIIDMDADVPTRTYIVNGVTVSKGAYTHYFNDIRRAYLEIHKINAAGTSVSITDLSATSIYKLPNVADIGYVLGSQDVMSGAAYGAAIPASTPTAVISFDDSVAVSGAVLKKDGQEIASSMISDGSKVYLTPEDGFAIGSTYSVEMSGITYGDIVYNRSVTTSFIVEEPALEIISPENNLDYIDRDVTIKVISPEAPVFELDGTVLDESKAVYSGHCLYTLTIPFAETNLGLHTLKATCGDASETLNFKLSSFFASKTSITYDALTSGKVTYQTAVITEAVGSDGLTDGAFTMSRVAPGTDAFINVYNNNNNLFVFDSDIKRDEHSCFMFELKGSSGFGALGTFGATDPASGKNNFIASTGSIAGTDCVLPSGEWHNVRIEADFAAKYVKVYYDGKLIKEGVDELIPDGVFQNKLQIKKSSPGETISFDNTYYYYSNVKNPDVSSIKYTKDEAACEYIEAENATVSALSESIQIALDSPYLSLGAENVLINGSADLAGVAYDASAGVITLSLNQPLDTNSEYVVTIDDTLSIGTQENPVSASKALDIRFSTDNEVTDFIGDFVYSEDKTQVSITISKANEASILPETALLIYALYDGNKLAEADCVPLTLTSGVSKEYSASLTKATASSEVKAMLWTSLSGLVPLK